MLTRDTEHPLRLPIPVSEMASHESDREDLLNEATALVRRAELTGPNDPEPVVIGFRRDGSLSVYFGADPVYHFDPEGRLKRAYVSGRLYRTQGDTLAELTRERSPSQTTLHRRDLSSLELRHLLTEIIDRITKLLLQHRFHEIQIARQVPESDNALWPDFEIAVKRIQAQHRTGSPLAPRFKGKR